MISASLCGWVEKDIAQITDSNEFGSMSASTAMKYLPSDASKAAAARRALFSNPAKVSGALETGEVAAGKRADLVLFSGDPLDTASSVIHVWRGGHGTRVAEPGKVNELESVRK